MTAIATPSPFTAPPTPRRSIVSGMLCAAAVALTACLPIAPLYVVPHFSVIFGDFDVDLPGVTKLVLMFPVYPAVVFCMLVTIGLIIKEALLTGHRKITIPLNLAVIMLMLLAWLILFVGLGIPLIRIQQHIA